jgi:hypothetical protein
MRTEASDLMAKPYMRFQFRRVHCLTNRSTLLHHYYVEPIVLDRLLRGALSAIAFALRHAMFCFPRVYGRTARQSLHAQAPLGHRFIGK